MATPSISFPTNKNDLWFTQVFLYIFSVTYNFILVFFFWQWLKAEKKPEKIMDPVRLGFEH